MPGLDPGILFAATKEDARVKSGHGEIVIRGRSPLTPGAQPPKEAPMNTILVVGPRNAGEA